MTVLSPFSVQSVAYATIQLQMAQYNELLLAAEQQKIANSYQAKVNSVNLGADKQRDLYADLDKTVSYLSNHVGRIRALRDKLNQLITLNWKAEIWGDSISRPVYARAFTAILNALNSTANTSSDNPNLLGSSGDSDYSYISTVSGQSQTVTQAFLGTDYSIVDSGGNTWKRTGEFAKFLTQYDSTGATTGLYASVDGGFSLTSLAGTAVDFTYKPGTTDATAYTGTLYRSGLKVLDSWLYGDLETSDGWSRASTDLNYAKLTIDAQLPRFIGALETALFYQAKANTEITGARKLVTEYTLAQAIELQEAESVQRSLNNVSSLTSAGIYSLRGEYDKLFKSISISPIFKTLIDLSA